MRFVHMKPMVLSRETLISIIATHLQCISAIADSDDVTTIQFDSFDQLDGKDLLSMRVYIKK